MQREKEKLLLHPFDECVLCSSLFLVCCFCSDRKRRTRIKNVTDGEREKRVMKKGERERFLVDD